MTDEEKAHCAKVAAAWADEHEVPVGYENGRVDDEALADLIAKERTDAAAKARKEALDGVIASMEAYSGGCDNYVHSTEFEERDHWRTRGATARLLVERLRALAKVPR